MAPVHHERATTREGEREKMKKSFLIGMAAVFFLTAGSMAQAQTIRDRAEYRPSSDIYFDIATGKLLGGDYPIPETVADREWQLNLWYQSEFSAESIEDFNDNLLTSGGLNFTDPDYYVLDMPGDDLSPIEFANLVTPDPPPDPPLPPTSIIGYADWTITGEWEGGNIRHTILSGNMNGNYLQTFPQKYRSFDGEGDANPQEAFNGNLLLTEVLGYTFTDLGDGTGRLTVDMFPIAAGPWGAASTVEAGSQDASGMLNYLFILIVPIGAAVIRKRLRKGK